MSIELADTVGSDPKRTNAIAAAALVTTTVSPPDPRATLPEVVVPIKVAVLDGTKGFIEPVAMIQNSPSGIGLTSDSTTEGSA